MLVSVGVLHTVGTSPVECEFVAIDRKPVLLADRLFQGGIYLDLVQVGNSAAAITNEMAVRFDQCIKPLLTLDNADALDLAPLTEKHQITVDGAQTQVRMGGLQCLIDPFGRGVAGSASNCIQNCFAFFTVSNGTFHNSPP